MYSERRIVITGIGAVTPLSSNAEGTWKKIIANQSGVGIITIFDPAESPCKIAGEVKYGEGEDLFNPDKYIDQKEQRKMGQSQKTDMKCYFFKRKKHGKFGIKNKSNEHQTFSYWQD